jgi:hypothetical protein
MEANGKWRNVKPIELALVFKSENCDELLWIKVVENLAEMHLQREEKEIKEMTVGGTKLFRCFTLEQLF